MDFSFEKYHGAGNDFLISDIRNHANPLTTDMISRLCDRHFGVGADGLILLEGSDSHDFGMRYFNSDGKEASMCGNGGRCITAFAHRHGIIDKETRFLASDGEHHAVILSSNKNGYIISLGMGDVEAGLWHEGRIFLDTGSPHLVILTEDLSETDIIREGRKWRYDPAFAPGGTNVNFIGPSNGNIHIRTYERGVEDETLACGTGATAAAIAWAILHSAPSPLDLMARGGTLRVSFRRDGTSFREVRLEGPASFVFSGKIKI